MITSNGSCQQRRIENGSQSSELLSRILNTGKRKRTVAEVFHAHQGRLIDKWEHYLPIYEKHFARYVGTSVRVLEIGVSHGGSLQMWADYFGMASYIWGVDIDPRCKAYGDEPQIMVHTCDQTNLPEGLKFDIVIDDGSHVKEHQEASFKRLWPGVSGVYLIEDCHTGYPDIFAPDAIRFDYRWVCVFQRPKRLIRGKPSRELRQDEIEAWNLYGPDA